MRILPVNTKPFNTTLVGKFAPKREEKTVGVSYNVGFYGLIPPAKRLQKSDYLISAYIREIGKARNFHGDKAVV